MSVPDAATEVVADVAEEVAEQATHIAEMSRGLSGRNLGFALAGLIVGTGVGGALGYIFTKRNLESKCDRIMAEAAEEIVEMREHYYARDIARGNQVDKPALEKIVRDQGYSVEEESTALPPMVVTPPTAVVEAAEEAREDGVETPPDPKEDPKPVVRNIWRDNAPPKDDWDWHKERSQRSPLRPYVIHRDEREENEAYDGVTYTYFEEDDVLCDEREEAISAEDRERIVGEANLEKFGHGSDDSSVVYIRNDQLEIDIEISLSPNSYVEEVHGLEPPEIKHAHRRRGRRSFDDE